MKWNLLLIVVLCYIPAIAQSTASANISTFSIEAPQLGVQKKIWVYLPSDYKRSSNKYPVLYMHDAQNLFDAKTSYSGEWHVDETLDSLKAQVIVIAIEHGNDKRLDELTPFKNEKHGGGNADAYLDFLVNNLKPYVDKNYRTRSGGDNTIIMGSSLGGLVSYYAVLRYTKVFGKAGVFSPSFWYTDDIYKVTEATPKIKGKLYFMAGDSESDDMVPDLEKMLVLVRERTSKKNVKSVIIPGGKHSETLWSEEFVKAYLWLMD
ncbi:MAG: alpha/beta hydrolase [Flavobacterium sp.]|nr:MAG: alpha/beta hydrolase [Flavobacterium sp.]